VCLALGASAWVALIAAPDRMQWRIKTARRSEKSRKEPVRASAWPGGCMLRCTSRQVPTFQYRERRDIAHTAYMRWELALFRHGVVWMDWPFRIAHDFKMPACPRHRARDADFVVNAGCASRRVRGISKAPIGSVQSSQCTTSGQPPPSCFKPGRRISRQVVLSISWPSCPRPRLDIRS